MNEQLSRWLEETEILLRGLEMGSYNTDELGAIGQTLTELFECWRVSAIIELDLTEDEECGDLPQGW